MTKARDDKLWVVESRCAYEPDRWVAQAGHHNKKSLMRMARWYREPELKGYDKTRIVLYTADSL
jgi:hypothetical protein